MDFSVRSGLCTVVPNRKESMPTLHRRRVRRDGARRPHPRRCRCHRRRPLLRSANPPWDLASTTAALLAVLILSSIGSGQRHSSSFLLSSSSLSSLSSSSSIAFVGAWKLPFRREGRERDGRRPASAEDSNRNARRDGKGGRSERPSSSSTEGRRLHVADASSSYSNTGGGGQKKSGDVAPAPEKDGPKMERQRPEPNAHPPTLDQLKKKAALLSSTSSLWPIYPSRLWPAAKKLARDAYNSLPTSVTQTLPAAVKSILLYKPPVGITAVYLTIRAYRNRASSGSALDRRLREETGSRSLLLFGRRRRRRDVSLDLDGGDSIYDSYGGAESVRAELCRAALEPYAEAGRKMERRKKKERLRNAMAAVKRSATNTTAAADMVQRAARAVTSDMKRRGRQSMMKVRKESARWMNDVDLVRRLAEEEDRLREEERASVGNGGTGGGVGGSGSATMYSTSASCKTAAQCASDALAVTCPPRGSRELFVARTVRPLSCLFARMDECLADDDDDGGGGGDGTVKLKPAGKARDDDDLRSLLVLSSRVSELRTLDALLRICRDRLLVSSSRLDRAASRASFWVRWHDGGTLNLGIRSWLRRTLRGTTLEDDRRQLALSRAAYRKEVDRLGRVQGLLLGRPMEMGGEGLIDAAAAGGNGGWSKREEDEDDGSQAISPEGAREVLNANLDGGRGGQKKDEWQEEAAKWSRKARSLIRDLATEVNPTDAVDPRLSEWADGEGPLDGDEGTWLCVLTAAENLARTRRAGEVRMTSLMDVQVWFQQVDFAGVPSTIATLGLAFWMHTALTPRWPTILEYAKKSADIVWGIVDVRFWRPLRDIALDLLNRRPHMLDQYALENEQRSLDNMLRDLGVGDGTPANRAEAVAAASRMYEEELRSGATWNLIRGRMVRLMLIQVQQLKAGLLQAMGSIDDLVDKNRLNVQLLASIPAVLILTYGTRFAFAAAFSLRTRSLRPKLLKDIQEDMNDCLRRIEWRLLTCGRGVGGDDAASDVAAIDEPPQTDDRRSGGQQQQHGRRSAPNSFASSYAAAAPLRQDELGEFALLIHSYLLLLEYATPPIPAKVASEIQSNIQQLLARGYEQGALQQVRLLGVIKSKNADLIKSYF